MKKIILSMSVLIIAAAKLHAQAMVVVSNPAVVVPRVVVRTFIPAAVIIAPRPVVVPKPVVGVVQSPVVVVHKPVIIQPAPIIVHRRRVVVRRVY
ncbi:MAG: hypothetical protein PW786_14615 [Arachidicoccus sp.]|nr:hypothetical protein [Arachidicoccus sp.]